MSNVTNGYESRMNQLQLPYTYKKTQVENVEVSTIVYKGGTGNLIVETMIFLEPGPTHGLVDFDSVRTIAGNEREQHYEWVAKVTDAIFATNAKAV